jgi:hypothetical protein
MTDKHKMKNTYQLIDTFNNRVISNHRSLDAAVRAKAKHGRAVKRANGQSSYVTYAITLNTQPIESTEIINAEHRVGLI